MFVGVLGWLFWFVGLFVLWSLLSGGGLWCFGGLVSVCGRGICFWFGRCCAVPYFIFTVDVLVAGCCAQIRVLLLGNLHSLCNYRRAVTYCPCYSFCMPSPGCKAGGASEVRFRGEIPPI